MKAQNGSYSRSHTHTLSLTFRLAATNTLSHSVDAHAVMHIPSTGTRHLCSCVGRRQTEGRERKLKGKEREKEKDRARMRCVIVKGEWCA